MKTQMVRVIKIIGLAALTAGIVDFLYVTTSVFMSGGSVVQLWQYVASGIFGSGAYSMGMTGSLYGIIFHFLIMVAFSSVIYFLYKKISVIEKHPVLSGLIYGICIWFVMNMLVVPLSNVGSDFPKIQLDMIFSLVFVVHMILGLLIVFITKGGLNVK